MGRVDVNAGSSEPSVRSREEYVLPLSFEPNQGQAENGVKFIARSAGYTLFLTPLEVVIAYQHSAVRAPSAQRGGSLVLTLVGGNADSKAIGQHELPGRSSYFAGRDPHRWRTGIPTYEYVQFTDVYPGIDVSYRGPQGRLEYEFSVSPNSEPARIAVEINGANDVCVHGDGNLVVKAAGRELQFHPAMAYQEIGSGRHAVHARYRLLGSHRVGFEVGAYDRSKRLFIGPVLRNSDFAESSGE